MHLTVFSLGFCIKKKSNNDAAKDNVFIGISEEMPQGDYLAKNINYVSTVT